MDDNELEKERVELYKNYFTRYRWWLIACVFLSALLLVFIYTEKLSISKAQYVNQFSTRLMQMGESLNLYKGKKSIPEYIRVPQANNIDREAFAKVYLELNFPEEAEECVFQNIDTILKVKSTDSSLLSPELKVELIRISNLVYDEALAKRTLNETFSQPQELPILGVSVPYNDFVIGLLVLLAIATTGLWLTLRSIQAVVLQVVDKNIRRLMRLHFVFSGLPSQTWTKVHYWLKILALFLPAIAGLSIVAFDAVSDCIISLWKYYDYLGLHLPFYLGLRAATIICLWIYIVIFCFQAYFVDARIDKEILND